MERREKDSRVACNSYNSFVFSSTFVGYLGPFAAVKMDPVRMFGPLLLHLDKIRPTPAVKPNAPSLSGACK